MKFRAHVHYNRIVLLCETSCCIRRNYFCCGAAAPHGPWHPHSWVS